MVENEHKYYEDSNCGCCTSGPPPLVQLDLQEVLFPVSFYTVMPERYCAGC